MKIIREKLVQVQEGQKVPPTRDLMEKCSNFFTSNGATTEHKDLIDYMYTEVNSPDFY